MSQYGTGGGIIAAQALPKFRFETLDSWRGICALLVAMMHFPASGWIGENAVVRGAYLFVDFFFVLSGVVIAHGYCDRLANGFGFGKFIALRLGRVWPLHAAVLLLFVAWEAARLFVPLLRGNGAPPFTGENDLHGLVTSLLLMNGTGLEDRLVWNSPSWSISSEFWAYMLFASAIGLLRTRIWIGLLAAVVLGPIVLAANSPLFMDTTYGFGLIRCVYGFSLGALIYMVMRNRLSAAASSKALRDDFTRWTALEIAAVTGVCLFVSFAAWNSISFAAPFAFGAALIIFMHERGLVSRILRMRAFLWLGTLSYGIYMLHIFVQGRLINVGTVLGRISGQDLIGPFEMYGHQFEGFGISGPLFGTVMMLVMVVCILIAAWLGNVLVEKPFQKMTRLYVDNLDLVRAEKRRRFALAIGQKTRNEPIGSLNPAQLG